MLRRLYILPSPAGSSGVELHFLEHLPQELQEESLQSTGHGCMLHVVPVSTEGPQLLPAN